MLQFRLRKHPRISLPTGESHFIIPLYKNQQEFGDLSQVDNIRAVLHAMHKKNPGFMEGDLHGMRFDPDELAAELHAAGRHTLPAIISGLFEKNAQGEGKVRWGDKTPYYVMHIPKLLEWFPDAQFIHLVRDGRDVALSLFGRKHDFSVYNAYFAAEYWESYIEKGRAAGSQLSSDQYIEVHYEDLLSKPDKTFKTICTFLGEEFSEKMFEIAPVKDPGATPLVHESLKAENIDKWRKEMRPAEIRAFESVAGNTLRTLGYETLTAGKPASLIEKILYRLHNKLLKSYWQQRRSSAHGS